MSKKKELLRDVTQEQIQLYLNDPVKKELIAVEVLKIAQHYITTHTILGIDKQDLLQDLFLEVWKRIDKYDSSKASFSTFCYWWFKSYVGTFIRTQTANPKAISLDIETVSDGSLTMMDSIEDESLAPLGSMADYDEVYKLAGPELRMWSEGIPQQDIAKKMNITQAQVSRRIAKNVKKIRSSLGLNEKGYID